MECTPRLPLRWRLQAKAMMVEARLFAAVAPLLMRSQAAQRFFNSKMRMNTSSLRPEDWAGSFGTPAATAAVIESRRLYAYRQVRVGRRLPAWLTSEPVLAGDGRELALSEVVPAQGVTVLVVGSCT